MDKKEYLEIAGDIRHAYDRKEYDKVLMYADELELRKVTDGRVLEMIADAYDAEGDTEGARELLEKAYEKTPMGRKLAYKLSEMAIREHDLDAAVTYYEDFRKMAPHDNDRILLKYKIGKAAGIAKKDLAKVLGAYCAREIDEQWMAELAELYQELGEKEKCNEVCDNIILWFADGIYVQKALELKQQNGGLTESQQNKLEELKAAAAAPAQPLPDISRDERELRPGSMEPETITDGDLDSILEEYITIEDATAPPPRMQTADLSDAMSSPALKKTTEKNIDPETEVIPVEEIRKADLSNPAARTEISQAKEAAKKAAEEETLKEKEDQTAKEIENEIVLEEMELKTLPLHEEVQEAIAENIGQPEPEEVPDILAAGTEKPAAEEVPAEAQEEAPEEEPKEPLFTSGEAAGKPFSNIEALQIARTAPPKDEASFWKMPEELSVGEEPSVEEFEEPVYGSHRWFEQPQKQEPEYEEPVFGAHRYVPQPEPEEDPYAGEVEIEQVEPEPMVIEQAEDEEYYQPRVSTIRTTSSGAELAGLYATAKYAEQDAQLSEQAAFVRKPSLGIKKVLSPEMFADPIAEPEYYEGPAYMTEAEAEAGEETAPEPQAYTEFEVFEAEEPKPEGPTLFPGFGEEVRMPSGPAAEEKEEAPAEPAPEEKAEPETAPESDDFKEGVKELEVSKGVTGETAFIRAVNAFEQEQTPEDASALETEFIPAAEVADLIKKENDQEEEVSAAGSALVDALFAEEFDEEAEEVPEESPEDLLPDDFEEKLLAFDRDQQKEAEEQSELARTIQDLKQRIAELEQAQNKKETPAPAEEAPAADEAAEEAAEAPAEESGFMLDGSLIDAIIAEDEQPSEGAEVAPAEEPAPEEPEKPEEETAEKAEDVRPSPFLFSVMPHETIEEAVPEKTPFVESTQTPAEEAVPEPESTPSVFIPSLNPRTEMPEAGKGVIPVAESSITEKEEEELQKLISDDEFEKELQEFEIGQKEDRTSEFGGVVQELELSSRAEELWEEAEPEEPKTDEAPVVEITASIPPVEEGSDLQVPEEPEPIEVPAPEEPVGSSFPVLETPEEIVTPAQEEEKPEEKAEPEPGPELVGFFTTKMKERERAALREAAELQEQQEPELSEFEKAMLAFEENNTEVPEEEFTPDELEEAMDEFLDESIEPWEEPEFGMPDFTESEFEQPEFLGADFDEPAAEEPEIEEPEAEEPEISAPAEEQPDISEEELESELSDFEKALLAFENSEAAKKEAAAAEPVFPVETPEEVPEEKAEEEPEEEPEAVSAPKTKEKTAGYRIPDDMREELSEFLLIDGMEERICNAIDSIITNKRNGDPTGGHLIITGDAKSGKTYLTISLIKAVGKEIGSSTGRVAKVQAEALNGKDMNKVFTKIKGSDLIIENAGYLNDETAENMIATMKTVTTSSMVILEGNELGVENILTKHPELEDIFRTRLDLAELSLSQWADLACDYAEQRGYSLDDMALLALHAKIDEMNLPTTRLVVEDVQGIIDRAIEKANRRSIGRRAKKKNRDGSMELNETDFM